MKRALKVVVSVALLGVALYLLDWEGVGEAIARLEPVGMAAAFVFCFSQFVFMGLRWHLLVRPYTDGRLVQLMKAYLYSTMLNTFTPANVGGDVYRFMQLRKGAPGGAILLCLVEERLLGLFSFLLAASGCTAAILLHATLTPQAHWFFLMCLLGAGGGCLVLLLLPVIGRRLAALALSRWHNQTLELIRERGVGFTLRPGRQNSVLWALSLLALFVWMVTCWLVAEQVGVGLSLPMLGAVVVLVELLRLVPVSIQGIGVREGGFAYLTHLLGGDAESGFLCAAICYLLLNVVFCFNALVSLLLPGESESEGRG